MARASGRPRRRAPRRAPAADATYVSEAAAEIRYVETSLLLAALLEGDPLARMALRAPGRRVTSALTRTEALRGVVRARHAGRLSAAQERSAVRALTRFIERCDVVTVTDEVLERAARPFPVEPVRTLDALHLATAELLGSPPQLTTILTRDGRIRDNAEALGYGFE